MLRALRAAGVFWIWRVCHRRHIVIVMFHGVMDPNAPSSWSPLRPQLAVAKFERAIELLSRYYTFVSLDAAVEMITGVRPVQNCSLVLTFDDGYRNNLKYALPVLQRRRAPAMLFVATGHIEARRPYWFDRLDYALQHAGGVGHLVQAPAGLRLPLSDRSQLRAWYQELRNAAKMAERDDREMIQEMEHLAEVLERQSGRALADIFDSDDWTGVVTWQALGAVVSDDVVIGSHTVDHLRLARVSDEIAWEQLSKSKRDIEEQTGRPCRHLCYPNGSFDRRVSAIANRCGYISGVTTEEGLNRAGDDPMSLRRIALPDVSDATEILAVVSGLSASVSEHRHRLLQRVKEIGVYWYPRSKPRNSGRA